MFLIELLPRMQGQTTRNLWLVSLDQRQKLDPYPLTKAGIQGQHEGFFCYRIISG
jgi:hypothetical protein